jgi:hypothetical protein
MLSWLRWRDKASRMVLSMHGLKKALIMGLFPCRTFPCHLRLLQTHLSLGAMCIWGFSFGSNGRMMDYVHGGMRKFDATIATSAHIQRRQRNRRRHSLEQVEGKGAPRVIALEGEVVVMGRAAGAQVRLDSKGASLRHALLRPQGTDCALIDNDSRTGVFLNGVKIHSAVLRDGDVIRVAEAVFVYSEG